MADETTQVNGPRAEEPAAKHGVGLVAIAVMGVHLLARLGGMIQKMVLGAFYGTSAAGDIATAVERVFQAIYYIPEELLTHSLLPVFNRVRKEGEGEEAAWRVASLTGTLQAILLVLLTLVFVCFTHPLCTLLLGAPEPTKLEKFELTVRLVRVAMLGLFCTSLGSLTYVILNAYKRFITPALGDVAQKVGIILGIVVWSIGFGRQTPMGYAVGFIIGGVLKLATHLWALRGKVKLVRPGFDFKNPALKELLLLMVPLLAGSLVSKGRDLLELRIAWATTVTGTTASLDFARKIVWMPVNILPYALGIAMFPFLADWALRGQREQVTKAFLTASRTMIYVFAPLTTLALLMGPQIVTTIYKAGQFGDESVSLVTAAFRVYAAAMIFYALEIIALQVYYAHRDTKTPFWQGLIASAIQLAVAYTMGLKLGLGNRGIAMGFATAKTLKVGIMWYQLRPRLTGFEWPSLLRMLAKTAIASLVLGLVVKACLIAGVHAHIDLHRKKLAFLFLGGASAVGLAAYLAASLALRIEELQPVLDKLKGKLKR